MTPRPQQPNPNELLLITREELERCCSQMSAAGYKVSANYVEASVLSRPAPSPRIDTTKCFEDIVYSSAPWKIYRQDAGMGEHDYAVFLNDVYFCRTEHSQTASEIIRAIRFTANTRNSEQHDAAIAAQAREKLLNVLDHEIDQAPDDEHDEDYWRGIAEVHRIIESLRSTPGGERT